MKEVWIIDTCRTPRGIGKQGKGSLSQFHPHHLGSAVLKAIAERSKPSRRFNFVGYGRLSDCRWYRANV